MESCDLKVSARWILPIAPDNCALENHALVVKDGVIADIDTEANISQRWQASEHLDLVDQILLPGLINCHGHAAMTLLRGAGEDQALQAWLTDTIWPLEKQHVSETFTLLGTELAAAEMIHSGTTTFADMYFFPTAVAQVADNTGMRAQVCFPVIEMPNAWSENVDECFNKGLKLFDNYKHNNRVEIALGPHSAYTVNPENLARTAMYANELDACIQIHLHENQQEVDEAMQASGGTWIERLADIGLLAPNLQAVHMTTVNDDDLVRIAESGTHVVHCPASNMKLASGYCDIERLTRSDVNVAIGTDGAASNNTLDLFAETRLAALAAKHANLDPTAGNARAMLKRATLGGAVALGMADQIGSLEVGKAADFIAVDTQTPSLSPVYDPFAAVIHGDAGKNVSTVYVGGQPLKSDGRLTTIDESELNLRVRQWMQQ